MACFSFKCLTIPYHFSFLFSMRRVFSVNYSQVRFVADLFNVLNNPNESEMAVNTYTTAIYLLNFRGKRIKECTSYFLSHFALHSTYINFTIRVADHSVVYYDTA